jgi:hypothetical protein
MGLRAYLYVLETEEKNLLLLPGIVLLIVHLIA